jgi:tetratricopeptide (TPR) repeat protein
VSTLLRWFSPAYRYALQAEAEGRYVDAARAYALCGQRLKVAEMHLLEAERRGAPASSLRELHVAAHFLGERREDSQPLRLRLGRLYLRVLKKSVLTPADRELCREAAELLLLAGDAASAGEAFELGGDLERAADAYELAGDIERVEALHGAAAARRQASAEVQEAQAAYRMHLELGQRKEALAALRRYAAVAVDASAVEAQRLLTELHERLLPPGQARLRQHGEEILYVGRFPLLLGRGADKNGAAHALFLPDPGLSRDHAQVECGAAPADMQTAAFALRDLGSKNGTTLNGLPISGLLPLHGQGEIGLGPHVVLHFSVEKAVLRLDFLRGLSRGLRVVASPEKIPLGDGVSLEFDEDDGQPRLHLEPALPSEPLLNGKRAPRLVQLLRGDVVEVAGRRYEVP